MEELEDYDTHAFAPEPEPIKAKPVGWMPTGTYVFCGSYDDWIVGPVVSNNYSFFSFNEGFGSGQPGEDWVTDPQFRWTIQGAVAQSWSTVLKVFPDKDSALEFARTLWRAQRFLFSVAPFLERVADGVFQRSLGDETEYSNLTRAVHHYEHAAHDSLAELVAHVKILTDIEPPL